MAKTTKVQEQSLESIMWNCRNALRGTVGGNEKNRDAVMGLVFLKFAGDKFDKRRAEIIAQYGDVPAFLEKKSFYLSENVFYLNETSRWSYIVKNAKQDDIAVIIDTAMKDIEDGNPPLKGALPQNLYTTLGTRPEQMSALISEIDKINEERFHERDLIGRVYEYFLQVFAIDSGTSNEKGEFYTPASIVQLIAEIIEPYSGVVYDPCCGSAGMFVSSIKFVERHNGDRLKVSVVGQERHALDISLAPTKHIAYVPDTSRRGDKMSLGFNGSDETYLVSSISTVFGTDTERLLPEYLMLFFARSEFDRYTRFHSWGSARETFGWEDMREVKIPIPDVDVQQSIVNIYNSYLTRREINEKLKAQIKDLCPMLIKGSLEEAGA